MNKNTNLKSNETGLISVVLTILIIIILSLIVIAFSQITRREQRQALDRQLSTQAFYAAESGVNEVVNKIRASRIPASGITIDEDSRNECKDDPIEVVNTPGASDSNIQVACVIYDAHPPLLEYAEIDKQDGKIIPLSVDGNEQANELNIRWNGANATTGDYTSCNSDITNLTLTPSCPAGMFRITLITTLDGVGKEQLYQSSFHAFVKPTPGGGTGDTIIYEKHDALDTRAPTQGNIFKGSCITGTDPLDTTGANNRCHVKLTNIPDGPGVKSFLQIQSLGTSNTVTIDAGGQRFTEAQIMVDSTGKVEDVLRRVKVRISYFDDYQFPAYVIDGGGRKADGSPENGGVCKRLTLHPEVVPNPNNTSLYDAVPPTVQAKFDEGSCNT